MNARSLFHSRIWLIYSRFQRSRIFLMTPGRRKPQSDLETVIDEPLKRG